MTTEIRFFALKSKKEKVLDRGQNGTTTEHDKGIDVTVLHLADSLKELNSSQSRLELEGNPRGI